MHRDASVLTARARMKRGVEATWDPVFIEISVIELADRSRVSVTCSRKHDGSVHELSSKAFEVLLEHLARRKALTRLYLRLRLRHNSMVVLGINAVQSRVGSHAAVNQIHN